MKKKIQFSHANGFPAKTYKCLLENFDNYKVNYVNKFGHSAFRVDAGWQSMTNELINSIENNSDTAVYGIGHSLGAYLTLLAAKKKPELFKKIILLDPPIFNPLKRYFIKLSYITNLFESLPSPAKLTRYRKRIFKDPKAAYKYFENKKLFKNFNKKCLMNYANYGLEKSGDEFTLNFSSDIEYEIFRTMPAYLGSLNIKVPVSFIYSNKFEVISKTDIFYLKTVMKNTQFILFNGGHLFPLEQPEKTAELIQSLIT